MYHGFGVNKLKRNTFLKKLIFLFRKGTNELIQKWQYTFTIYDGTGKVREYHFFQDNIVLIYLSVTQLEL